MVGDAGGMVAVGLAVGVGDRVGGAEVDESGCPTHAVNPNDSAIAVAAPSSRTERLHFLPPMAGGDQFGVRR